METLRKRFTSLFFISMLMISILSAAGNTFPVQAQDTPDKTPITFYNLTKVSPNQEYIVSVSADDLKMTGSSIWLGEPFEADSTILASGDLLNGNYWVTNPIWSPESDQVAYLKVFDSALEKESNAPRFELWAIGIDKTNDRLLTNDIRLNPALGLAGQTYLAWTAPNEIEFLDSQALPAKKYTLNTETLEIKESGELNKAEIQGLTATFNKLAPTNGATVTADTMPYYFLTWDVMADSKYEYCIDLTNNNNCDDGNWISRTAPYVTKLDMTFLEGGKTYYWQVRTKEDSPLYANGGTWWNFKFNQGPPGSFVKIEPINSVIKTELPIALKWGASVGAQEYKYCVDLLPNCIPSTLTTTATTVAWNPPAGEPAEGIATYYWKVAAINSTGQTFADGGSYGIFILNIKPGPFGKTAPVINAQTSVTPSLSWEKSERASSYEYCVSETQICTSGWVNAGNQTNIVVSPALTAPKTYYWQVRAKYSGVTVEANAGSWWPFTTVPAPAAFSKTSPTDAALGQSLSPTLSWEASPGVTSYEYCYSSAPGSCSAWHSVGINTVTLSGLSHSYTYYWQVRAVNLGGITEANGVSWWSFTTTDTSACTWPAYTAPVTATFGDVPISNWAWSFIERLSNANITAGCEAGNYCPDVTVTRAEMAVFLLKAKHCGSYSPPLVGESTGFDDVDTGYWAAAWIKQLAAEGITGGCGVGLYCPEDPVTRAQMAVFLLKAKHGTAYIPPATGAGSGFTDVAEGYWAAAWIKRLAADAITGGCGPGLYCPENPVTRAQMAVFIVKTFGLP